MTTIVGPKTASGSSEIRMVPLFDTDVHPTIDIADPQLRPHMSKRTCEYLDLIGLRNANAESQRIMPGHGAMRVDARTPDGRGAGTDPDYAREQLLDAYDVSAAILNNGLPLLFARGADGLPVEVSIDLVRANNDWLLETWLSADPRWYGSLNVCYEDPVSAVAEIARCVSMSDRFVNVELEQRGELPLGNPRYWPVYEAAEHYGLPIALHVGMHRRMTGTGEPSFYFEDHTGFELRSFHIVSSFVFERVFDRFPKLQIVLLEMGWAWAAPLAWRLDSCWQVLRDEVPHLQRRPSEYMRDHFWLATQPMEEPTNQRWFVELYEQFEETLGKRLLFASDYPHWDFDSPTEALPSTLPIEDRAAILGESASSLYGIPLKPGSGIPVRVRE